MPLTFSPPTSSSLLIFAGPPQCLIPEKAQRNKASLSEMARKYQTEMLTSFQCLSKCPPFCHWILCTFIMDKPLHETFCSKMQWLLTTLYSASHTDDKNFLKFQLTAFINTGTNHTNTEKHVEGKPGFWRWHLLPHCTVPIFLSNFLFLYPHPPFHPHCRHTPYSWTTVNFSPVPGGSKQKDPWVSQGPHVNAQHIINKKTSE